MADLTAIVTDFFASLDREDVGELIQAFSDDAQAVDEIGRRWMRGRADLADYFAELGSMVTDIRSDLTDLQDGYLFNRNGTAFLGSEGIDLRSGDCLLLLSSQAGG